MTYRIKVNEKTLGAALVVIGLVGMLAGFRFLPERADSQAPVGQQSALSHRANGFNSGKTADIATQISPDERQACRVLTVYDGDTIGCDLDGDGRIQKPREEIRLLGMDTPERSYSRKNPTYGTANPTDEPYAKESSAWMERQVTHKTVYLEYDLRRNDRYRRTLAFVYLSPKAGESLNLQAVKQGYASILFIGKNRLYEDQFIQAEAQARKAKRGLWGLQ